MEKARDHRIDNLKGMLIVLVVFAHFCSLLGFENKNVSSVWGFINSFHMASFLVISGFLSYNRVVNRSFGKTICKGLVPYFIAQFGLYILFMATGTQEEFLSFDPSLGVSWLRPYGALWYIFAISVYVLFTSINWDIFRDRLGKIFIFSICVSVIAGYFYSIWYFRFTKLITYYPFFIFGIILRKTDKLKRPKNKGINSLALLASFAVVVLFIRRFRGIIRLSHVFTMEEFGKYEFMFFKYSDTCFTVGPIIRIISIAIALIIAMSLLSLFPQRVTILSSLGKNSLYIYIGHWFLLKIINILLLKHTGASTFPSSMPLYGSNLSIVLLFIASFIIARIFSCMTVVRLLHPVLEPNIILNSSDAQ